MVGPLDSDALLANLSVDAKTFARLDPDVGTVFLAKRRRRRA
jgi:hypothetical protein